MSQLQNGERVHLVDKKGRQYALTLKAGDIYHFSGETIPHDELIGKPDGTVVTLSKGKRFLALRPTFGEYVLKMPRGAQVLYPKDLSLIPMWADVYPGARFKNRTHTQIAVIDANCIKAVFLPRPGAPTP